MNFDAKLALFRAGELQPDRRLSPTDLAVHAIGGIQKYLAHVLFEPAAALSSPAIGKPHEVLLGAHSYMNEGGYLRDRVAIGRFCSIGRRVTIGAGMHATRGLSTSPFLAGGKGRNYTAAEEAELGFPAGPLKPAITILEHDVWVGDGAVIMPGLTVATGAIIGANAVVTRDVAAYTIVGGVPAKPIGRRFREAVAARLLASRYWELADTDIKSMPARNVFAFLEALAASPKPAMDIETLALVNPSGSA